jgi:DNA helicase HerA-like ATPase
VRSKGVGVYFVTQNPIDIPDTVLAQLGNRVQHALRAYTPRDQKAVRTTAETMRPNPAIDIKRAITELATGEALVSFLDEKGRPGITQRVFVIPPGSQIGPITPEQRQTLLSGSLVAGTYEKMVDRESAYEKLQQRGSAEISAQQGSASAPGGEDDVILGTVKDVLFGRTGPRGGKSEGILESAAKSAARSIGSNIGRQIVRGVLGSLLGGRR